MAKVFISYAPADARTVERIASAIRDMGHSVKLGRANIKIVDAGGRLAASVLELKHCDVLVTVLSPAAARSSAIIGELKLAEQTYRPIIPLIIESVKLPPEIAKPLRYLTKIDCTPDAPEGINRLRTALAKR
jgi:hypothetical protein